MTVQSRSQKSRPKGVGTLKSTSESAQNDQKAGTFESSNSLTGSTGGLEHRGQLHHPFAFQLSEQMPTRDLAQSAIVLAPIPNLA